MSMEEQVASIYAATRGLMDDIPVDRIRDFEGAYLSCLRDAKRDVLNAIKDKKALDAGIEEGLKAAAARTKQSFSA
jgi:F-type H+-transporting ATPase subunit alpha